MAVYSNLGWYQSKSTQHVGPNDFWSVAYRYFLACEPALSGGWRWEPPRELARRLDICPHEKHRERLFWLGLSADLKLVTSLIEWQTQIHICITMIFFLHIFRASESKKKGSGKGKKGKGKSGGQARNKMAAGKSGRKSGKKRTKT